jgi:hypothetical protein
MHLWTRRQPQKIFSQLSIVLRRHGSECFPALLLRRSLTPLRVCETNKYLCEWSRPALLKSVWKCEILEFDCLCRLAMRGLHYGHEVVSTNRPNTFGTPNYTRQRFCSQSRDGPYISMGCFSLGMCWINRYASTRGNVPHFP